MGVELKLLIDPKHKDALMHHPLLSGEPKAKPHEQSVSDTYFDTPDPLRVGSGMSAAVERLLRSIERDRVDGDPRFVDVQFGELMADPLAAVRRVYAAAGRAFGAPAEAAMRQWLVQHPRGRHGAHAYAARDFGIDLAERHAALAFYHRRFAVPLDAR